MGTALQPNLSNKSDSGVKDHTHSNDTAFIDTGEALIVNNRVKRLIHPILENKSRKLAKNDCWWNRWRTRSTGTKERIRAGGAGLGGI